MRKHILNDLSELMDAGIISNEASDKIRAYYQNKWQASPSRFMLVFGILGSLLTGLGIILIIAHNWDDFSKPLKLFFALLPLLLGQFICGFTLLQKAGNRVWRESASVFLFFAIGSSISIVSQVYNLEGTLSGFLLTWMALSIPVVYIMQSSMTSLLVISGITWYACEVSYFGPSTHIAWYYWLMLASLIPYFLRMLAAKGNFFYFHCWLLSFSVMITLGMFTESEGGYILPGYMSLFSILMLLGGMRWFSTGKMTGNAFLITGSFGLTTLLLILTFQGMWVEVVQDESINEKGFAVSSIVTLLAGALLVYEIKQKGWTKINPTGYVFLVFILLFFLGKTQPEWAQWLTNILVLTIAVVTTWRGVQEDNLFILNYGLLILTALILCRFFDTDLSFVVRGILFMVVGFSFFGVNYWMMRRRRFQNV